VHGTVRSIENYHANVWSVATNRSRKGSRERRVNTGVFGDWKKRRFGWVLEREHTASGESVPYSATMLFAYDFYKKKYADKKTGELSVPGRLLAGASAACTATIVTYPLDIIRLRLSIDPTTTNMVAVFKNILREEGVMAFAKGLPATCLSIAPYSALNFCAFDLFKQTIPEEIRNEPQGIAIASLMATAVATGSCYPLDTVRRQMQMKSSTATNVVAAAKNIVANQGVGGLFRGFVPNAVKNMPNKSIQLTTYDVLKKFIARSEIAYEAEKKAYLKDIKMKRV
jgi:solute carrier family 25 phosphate transporter 23/24/25/41